MAQASSNHAQRMVALRAREVITKGAVTRGYDLERDPASRIMMEEILAKEEEHADDLTDLLFAVEPQGADRPRSLHFADEAAKQGREGGASEPRQ